MLLEGKGIRIFFPTNGGKTGFSGDMGDWVGGKLLKGKGEAWRLRGLRCWDRKSNPDNSVDAILSRCAYNLDCADRR
jgi:hypothetical protein